MLPAAASAHAYLVKTVPSASGDREQLRRPHVVAHLRRGGRAALRDHLRHRRRRPPGDGGPAAPLARRTPTRWSCRSKPARRRAGTSSTGARSRSTATRCAGAFTFAVGPEPGPAPQFPVPLDLGDGGDAAPRRRRAGSSFSARDDARSGCSCCGSLIARPLVRRVEGTSLRRVSLAFAVAASCRRSSRSRSTSTASTAEFSLRSAFDVGALVPLLRRLGLRARLPRSRALLRAVRRRGVDRALGRPAGRASAARSPSCSPPCGALVAAAAVLVVPGAAGHAAQTLAARRLASRSTGCTSHRGLDLDRRPDRAAALALGSLPAGRRVAGLAVVVPRFSNVALVSVLVAARHGHRATRHPPAGRSRRSGRPPTGR